MHLHTNTTVNDRAVYKKARKAENEPPGAAEVGLDTRPTLLFKPVLLLPLTAPARDGVLLPPVVALAAVTGRRTAPGDVARCWGRGCGWGADRLAVGVRAPLAEREVEVEDGVTGR